MVPVLDAFRLALLNRNLNKCYCSMKEMDGNSPRGPKTIEKLNALLVTFECFKSLVTVLPSFHFLKVKFLNLA